MTEKRAFVSQYSSEDYVQAVRQCSEDAKSSKISATLDSPSCLGQASAGSRRFHQLHPHKTLIVSLKILKKLLSKQSKHVLGVLLGI